MKRIRMKWIEVISKCEKFLVEEFCIFLNGNYSRITHNR